MDLALTFNFILFYTLVFDFGFLVLGGLISGGTWFFNQKDIFIRLNHMAWHVNIFTVIIFILTLFLNRGDIGKFARFFENREYLVLKND